MRKTFSTVLFLQILKFAICYIEFTANIFINKCFDKIVRLVIKLRYVFL
jgi:hypothetical protein